MHLGSCKCKATAHRPSMGTGTTVTVTVVHPRSQNRRVTVEWPLSAWPDMQLAICVEIRVHDDASLFAWPLAAREVGTVTLDSDN